MTISISIDTAAALERFLHLAAIPGISGEEAEVADAVIVQLKAAGVPDGAIQIDDANRKTKNGGQIGNLMVHLPGTVAGPTTLLSAHLDTVPVCVGSQPLVDGDYVRSAVATGLGADNRGGCAAILTAAIELLHSGQPHPPLTLCWFVQEEIGLEGSRNLNRELLGPVDRAINFDGGNVTKMTIGATGGERMTINVTGLAAHAGVAPESGVSAIVIAAKAIARLHDAGWLGLVRRPDGSCGTSNVGVFQGGDATNVIAPTVHLRAEARSHQPATRAAISAAIQEAFHAAAAGVHNDAGVAGQVAIESQVDYEAFLLADDCPSVLAASAALRSIGCQAVVDVTNGGLDANWLYQHGIAAVTLGCGQREVHTVSEQLYLPDYFDACRVATLLASGGWGE